MKMSIHIFNLLNVYTFLKNQATWSNETKRHVSIVSYQVEGHYNHTFPFGELEVKKDRVFTINPSDTYFVKQISPGHSICFVFTSDTPIATELIDCSNNPRFYHLFKKILQYKNLRQPEVYYKALSVAYEILALIEEKHNTPYYQISKTRPFIEVRDRLLRDFANPTLNTREFYAEYGFSDKYFREKFRTLFGSTPTQYLINLRLNEAAKLLSSGTYSVGEVAEAVGFSDIYYFSRLFKKRFLCSPSNFKNHLP